MIIFLEGLNKGASKTFQLVQVMQSLSVISTYMKKGRLRYQ